MDDEKKPAPDDDAPPPWGGQGYGLPYRPELIPPVDPTEFQEAIRACVPDGWPAAFASTFFRPPNPIVYFFGQTLMNHVRINERRWTPIHERFVALLRLLDAGELGPGWPSQRELIESHETFKLHPALVHTASQLPLLPEVRFDPVEFRREAMRTAKRMGLALPPGCSPAEP
jgi:hypothetical protein